MEISKTVKSPCKDCNDRWINTETLERCHGSCEKYKIYKDKIEDNRHRFNQERKVNNIPFEARANWDRNKRLIQQEKRKKLMYKTL